MAKQRKQSARKPKRRVVKMKMVGADRESYKRVLVDPCYAELPQTPYNAGAGGTITRVRKTVLGPAITTNVAQVVFFHPVFGSYSIEGLANFNTTVQQYNQFYNPLGDATAGRAIAGCLSATYVGPESTRSGIIHCGLVSGSLVSYALATAQGGSANNLAAANLLGGLSHMERMPVDKCEVNWVPGEGDCSFAAVGLDASNKGQVEALFEKTNFCVIIATGFPTGGNVIEWNATGVVETLPTSGALISGNNVAFDVSTSTRPPYDYRDVVRELGRKDPSWFIGTFKKAWKFVGGVARGYATAGLPGALGYLIGASPSENVGSRSYIRANK